MSQLVIFVALITFQCRALAELDNFQPAFPKNYETEKRQNLWPYKNEDYEELEKQNPWGKRENFMKDQNPWGKRQNLNGKREVLD